MKDDVQDSQIDDEFPQRQALRAILDEGEQKVPSTTANILAAIRREQQAAQKVAAHGIHDARNTSFPAPLPLVHEIETPRPKRSRRTSTNVFALTAVAAALIISFGLLSLLISHNPGTMSGAASTSSNGAFNRPPSYASSIPATSVTWSAVIMTYKGNNTTLITNYNPVTSISITLASLPYADTIVDGVSHNGHEVLYSVYDGSQTSYYIYPQATTNAIFTTPEKSRSAIWSTDDRTLFISTAKGIMSVDVQTYAVKLLFPMLPSVTLLNYRDDGYLYYVQGNTGQSYATEGTFHRINIAGGNAQQITTCTRGTNFWLSPGGKTVYYNCLDQNATILYAINNDGTHPSIFRSNGGSVIGYAADNSPLTLAQVNGKYQVVQRDTQSTQDTVLLQDVVPGATTIAATDIAVAPYGQMLVAKGTYSTLGKPTEEHYWYSELITGKSQMFVLPQGTGTAQAIGWDRLQVGANANSTIQPTPTLP